MTTPVEELHREMARELATALVKVTEFLGRLPDQRESNLVWSAIQTHHGVPKQAIKTLPASIRDYIDAVFSHVVRSYEESVGRPSTKAELKTLTELLAPALVERLNK